MTNPLQQAHRSEGRHLTPDAAFRRAVATIDKSGLLPVVEHTLHAASGRPREFTARALLVGMVLHTTAGATTMVMTEIVDGLRHLTSAQRNQLEIGRTVTYPQLWHAFDKLAQAISDDRLTDPATGQQVTANQFADRIIAASIPDTYQVSTSMAIDGTDFETWGRRRSWGNKKSVSTAGTEIPDGTVIAPAKPVNELGWPRIGHDGAAQNSPDPDARDGYRSGHNGRPGDVYIGYELHLATQVPAVGGDPIPHIVTGLTITPAGSHRGEAAVRTIDGMTATGLAVTELCVDRGYSYCKPATFTYPMWARGLDIWADLHPNQRLQRPGPIQGTIWIDGSLYSTALPASLRNLDAPARFATAPDATRAQQLFDQRRAYAFTPLGKRDRDGYQRLKGPALAKHVRCINNPKTRRLSHARPTTNCVTGTPCACGKTVTITPDQAPRERMPQPWGTTDWAAAYRRRAAIESVNAELKTHRLKLGRGFTRLFGRVRNTLLTAFAIAGSNIRLLRTWHAKRNLPDPWATALDETDLGDGVAVRVRTRARRRTGTLQELLGDPPPDNLDGTGLPS